MNGTYLDNDYCVYEDGRSIGRMYQTHAPGGATCWRWFVQVGQVAAGSADTLEEAKAAFRSAWNCAKPMDGARRNGQADERSANG
jgi:hypothetical protein